MREPLDLMQIGTPAKRRDKVSELFVQVGLCPEQQALFRLQSSGGQRQRIGLARAFSARPELIVCDEPMSALDVAIKAQIFNLLADLQVEPFLPYLFISHDLGVVQHICDVLAVMYLGQSSNRKNGSACSAIRAVPKLGHCSKRCRRPMTTSATNATASG